MVATAQRMPDVQAGAPWLGACRDRLRLTGETPWRINPRTEFLEARVPLTWAGIRRYRGMFGRDEIRVLHRPSQIRAASFLATLCRLPAAVGHPTVSGAAVDIKAGRLAERFVVGATGDTPVCEAMPMFVDGRQVGVAEVPVGTVSVWQADAIRQIQNGATQTSLGYLPLWAPPAKDEIMNSDTGHPVGLWVTDAGQFPYDYEHILDATDPRVVALAEAEGFSPAELGGNHIAVALQMGRGGEASELLRIVDCRDSAGRVAYFFGADGSATPAPTQDTGSAMTEPKMHHFVLRVQDQQHAAALAKRGLAIPAIALDMPEGSMEKLKEMQGMLNAMAMEIGKMVGEVDEANAAAETAKADAEKATGEAQVATEEMAKVSDQLKAATAELDKLRASHLESVARDAMTVLGVTDVADLPEPVAKATDEIGIKRAVVDHLHPELKVADATDDMVVGMYKMLSRATDSRDGQDRTQVAPLVAPLNTASPFGNLVKTGDAKPRERKPSALREAVNAMR